MTYDIICVCQLLSLVPPPHCNVDNRAYVCPAQTASPVVRPRTWDTTRLMTLLLSLLAHTCNADTEEAEAGGLGKFKAQ